MASTRIREWLTEDNLIRIEGWARDGLTDEQIAHNMDIAASTFYEWKRKNEEISEALKKGKEVVDYEVENALLKRALGYTERLNKQKVTKDGDVVDIEEDIHIPGDVTAMIFWLKNRRPDVWREKPKDSDNEKNASINENILNIANLINNPLPNRGENDVQ